ncbi:MAG: DPP IV N-terminal domain-containing protein, partial [Chitinophagaceae bacterium]|nr:DPP IV N-terminal domain-containing protein [Chitinophagaceae bacterium]
MSGKISRALLVIFIQIIVFTSFICAQQIKWSKDGNAFYIIDEDQVVLNDLANKTNTILVKKEQLTPSGEAPLSIRDFSLSEDGTKMLIYTNTRFVWRLDTQGDYWVLELASGKLQKVGPSRPASSLRFAKFSPDGKKVAYVSEYNLYVYDLNTSTETALTKDGNRRYIHGTFDWVYEEEFACRDGFQWSPDGKRIAFFNTDASGTRDFFMINNTDSMYSRIIPVEYPKVGESPSAVRIGVVEVSTGKTEWLNIPGDPRQHYLPRIEWNSDEELFAQQLNRKQNQSIIFSCNIIQKSIKEVFRETDPAWIDVYSPWEDVYNITYRHRFHWINQNKEFLWLSEKEGWRQLYRMSKSGNTKKITTGDYDV